MPSYPYALTIVNPGAELGSTTGWTNITGTLRAVQSAGGNAPLSGLWFFMAGASGSTEARQDVALPPDVLADVDTGSYVAKFVGHMAGFGDGDEGWLSVTCLNGAGVQLGETEMMPPAASSSGFWLRREVVALIQPGTRTLRLGLHGTRKSGTNLDVYWDDFELSLRVDTYVPPQALDEVPGLDLWFDAATLAQADGTVVGSWADRRGNGKALTAPSAEARPIYRSAGTAGIAQLPTTYFDRVDDRLNGDYGNYAGRAGLTVYAIIDVDEDLPGSAHRTIVGRDGPSARGWSLALNAGNVAFLVSATSGTSSSSRCRRTSTGADLRATPAVVCARFDGALRALDLWINGIKSNGATDGAGVPATMFAGGAAHPFSIGSSDWAEPFAGHIHMVAVYDRALSTRERADVESLLLRRAKVFGLREDISARSPSIPVHQGYATDGARRWTADTARLDERDESWGVIRSNATPFAGISGANHLGDPAYHEGRLYVPAQNWGSCSTRHSQHLAVFDADTLALERAVNIAAQNHEVSAVTVDPERGLVWVGSYCEHQTLYAYRLSDLSFSHSLALSAAAPWLQGISYRAQDGFLWASLGGAGAPSNPKRNGSLVRINPDTGSVRYVFRPSTVPYEAEGIDIDGAGLWWLFWGGGIVADQVYRYDLALEPTSPPAPSGLVATLAGTTATLTWTPPAAAVDAQVVQRRIAAGGYWERVAIRSGTAATHTDTVPLAGVAYEYRVLSYDLAGRGISNVAATSGGALPALVPPVILAPDADAVVTARPVRIAWTPAEQGA